MLATANLDNIDAVKEIQSIDKMQDKLKTLKINSNDQDWDKEDTIAYQEEPLLVENNKRFVLFPIEYNDIWKSYKHIELKFWTADDIETDDDVSGFNKLSGKERTFLTHASAMLAAGYPYLSDEAIDAKLSDEIQLPEARCFFGFEMMQRNMHLELFNKFLDSFVESPEEHKYIFEAVLKFQAVSKRQAWVQSYLTQSLDHYSTRIAAMAIFNAIFQKSLVFAILHSTGKDARMEFGTRHEYILPGLVRSIAKLQIDLHLYKKFCTMLSTKYMKNRPNESYIHKMVKELVEIEIDMLREVMELAGGNLSLADTPVNVDKIKSTIYFLADEVLTELGFSKLYNVNSEQRLSWIDEKIHKEMAKEDPEVFSVQTNSNRGKIAENNDSIEKVELTFSLEDDF